MLRSASWKWRRILGSPAGFSAAADRVLPRPPLGYPALAILLVPEARHPHFGQSDVLPGEHANAVEIPLDLLPHLAGEGHEPAARIFGVRDELLDEVAAVEEKGPHFLAEKDPVLGIKEDQQLVVEAPDVGDVEVEVVVSLDDQQVFRRVVIRSRPEQAPQLLIGRYLFLVVAELELFEQLATQSAN